MKKFLTCYPVGLLRHFQHAARYHLRQALSIVSFFDEASQCDIASALPLLYRAKRAVVIGDPQQLSHISSIQKKQDQKLLERFDLVEDYIQWAYSWNSLYGMAQSYASSEDFVNLRDHHRSHADIINFSTSSSMKADYV